MNNQLNDSINNSRSKSNNNYWIYYDDPSNINYIVNVFDDGHIDKKEYINSWKIYGEAFNGGKVALINTNNTDIKITSISSWKIKPHPMETPMSSLL